MAYLIYQKKKTKTIAAFKRPALSDGLFVTDNIIVDAKYPDFKPADNRIVPLDTLRLKNGLTYVNRN